MKILLLTQWFDPEPSFKGLPFAKELLRQGHQVEVLTGFPNYPGGKIYSGYKVRTYQKDLMDGIVVHRVALYPDHGKSALKRIFNYVSFGVTSFIAGTFKLAKYDVIYAYHPPLTTGLSALLVGFFRRTPVVVDIQDLWPDTLAATGMLSNKRALSVVDWFCDKLYAMSSHIVVLSPGFKKKLIQRGVPVDKVSVVYNWCDENAMSMTEYCPFKLPESGFNLVFAGNMGQAQGLETIIEAARISSDQKIDANFILVGDGVSKSDAQDLASRYSLSNVYFIPRVPMNQVGELLRCSDALLVHLRDDDLFRITIPSRTQAYLFTGKPILMAVQGDASELIKISKSGVCCNSDDPEGMAAALKALVDLPKSTSQQFGINGRSYYENNLSMTKGVSRFIDIFSKVIK